MNPVEFNATATESAAMESDIENAQKCNNFRMWP